VGLILDTSALIELERALSTGRAGDFPWDEPLAVPAVVWAEALIGVRLADSPARAARRRAHLEVVRLHAGIEPFTAEIAEHYADIFAELSAAERPIPQNDIAVAATGRALKFGVLVGPGDEAHFRCVPGLEVRVVSA
jgi:predicted nucleic acid-binding protein